MFSPTLTHRAFNIKSGLFIVIMYISMLHLGTRFFAQFLDMK